MGVTITNGTLPGGMTPVCSCCGSAESWDISEEEYQQSTPYWDSRVCKDCAEDKLPWHPGQKFYNNPSGGQVL